MVTYPIDWDERSIGDFVHVGRGASPRPIEAFLTSSVDGVNWIKIGDAPRYGKYITQTAEKITQSGATRSVRVDVGDFILSNSMSFGRPYILNIDGCIHDGWLRLYDYQDSVDKEFLYYVLSSEDTKKQYATFAAGSGVQNLNKAVVKKVVVHLPSIPEQKRIARALSEMDDHIDNLTELIEKKKAIRDGALEDLMSGRTRLARFHKKWVPIPFEEYLPHITGIKVSSVSKKSIKTTELLIPSDVEEQEAITGVLVSMDDEIKDLEDERNKMIQIREGAMDDLLTGRVRLSI